MPILAEPKGGSGGRDGWAHHRERLSGAAMTFTFKLARRLARFRSGALMASLLTVACAGEAPSGPDTDPNSDDLTAIDVFPDTATVGVDGEVQFDASAAPADQTSADYRSWWRTNRVVAVRLYPSWVKLAPGSAKSFTGTGVTASGASVRLLLQWKATGGTVNQWGKYVAGKRPGTYLVVASTSSGLADTAKVVVSDTDGGTPTRDVVLTPESVQLSSGEQRRFSLTGRSSDGSSFSVTPRYQATGGTIAGDGTFTAGQTRGTYRVIATDEGTGMADTSAVTIGATDGQPATVASVTVSPASASLSVGATKQLSATVRDQAGNTMANADVSWTSSNSATAKVNASGLVTAQAAGQAVITATSGGKSDQSSFTVTASAPVEPPPTGDVSGCPASGYTRLVSVGSSTQLSSALSSAQPGDQIRMAAGTYSGIRNITRSGTSSQPIVLCGSRSAVLTGDTRLNNADWWVLQGFTMRDGFQPIYAMGANNNRIQGLEIYNTGQEAIHFRCGSSDNVVQGNWIHDTGRSTPQYGEAVYLGTDQTQWSSMCGSTQPDRSDRNKVIDNQFGPNVRGDHIDIKEGTTGGVIRGNNFNGTGTALISGMVYDWITVKGNNYTIEDNRGSRAPRDGIWGFVKVQGWGNNNVYRGNVFDVQASGYGIRSDGGSGNVVYCDNVVTNAGSGRSNLSCR